MDLKLVIVRMVFFLLPLAVAVWGSFQFRKLVNRAVDKTDSLPQLNKNNEDK